MDAQGDVETEYDSEITVEAAEEESTEEESAEEEVVEEEEPAEEEEPVAAEEEEAASEEVVEEEEAASEEVVEEEEAAAAEEEEPAAAEEEEEEEEPAAAEEEEPVAAEEEEVAEEEPKSTNQRIAELEYMKDLAGKWAGREIKRVVFEELWENRNVAVDESVDYKSKIDDLEKLPEIILLWNTGANMRNNNHFKNLEGYSLEKKLFSDEKTIEEKLTALEKVEDILIKCANFSYKGKKDDLINDISAIN
jgi:hypothetical protein